jgi:hypothetical protein
MGRVISSRAGEVVGHADPGVSNSFHASGNRPQAIVAMQPTQPPPVNAVTACSPGGGLPVGVA